MVKPLLDLQEREIFSRKEIQAIVARRRQSEYALRRRQPRKADFLSYIQAEQQLEKLRKLRMKRMKRLDKTKRDQQGPVELNKEGDKHITRLIHLLWTRTLRKYASDLALHLQYAEFCKETHAHSRLSRVYAQALQIFPRHADLWIQAASHEYFGNNSIRSARILLQRGLRLNTKSQQLWLQYFCLELHVVQKLQARRSILLGDHSEHDRHEKEGNSSSQAVAMARLVFDQAIQANPTIIISLCKQFLDQCRLFPHNEALEQHILARMTQADSSPDEVQVWMTRVLHQYQKEKSSGKTVGFMAHSISTDREERNIDSFGDGSVLSTLREATQKVPSRDMYQQAINFLRSYMDEIDGSGHVEDVRQSQQERVQCSELLAALVSEVAASNFYSSEQLALDCAEVLQEDDEVKAMEVLEQFVRESKADGGGKRKASALVWMRWAGLAATSGGTRGVERSVAILEQGLRQTSMDRPDYMFLLLQLIGAKMRQKSGIDVIVPLLERIMLLAPGFVELEALVDPPFDIKSIPGALLRCIQYATQHGGLDSIRRVYKLVLIQSNFVRLVQPTEELKMFFEESIKAENKALLLTDAKSNKDKLRQLYEIAGQVFGNSSAGYEFRQQRDSNVLLKEKLSLSTMVAKDNAPCVPSFDMLSNDFSPSIVTAAFEVFQVVHLRNLPTRKSTYPLVTWKDVGEIFNKLDSKDKDSWCVENAIKDEVSQARFLQPRLTDDRGYCSFLIQHDKLGYEKAVERLPLQELSWLPCSYHPALWVFFGRNPPLNERLEGRKEHTDSVSHDGTWHYQLSGSKGWFLRPSQGLLYHFLQYMTADRMSNWSENTSIKVECKQGDVLVINTKLWFHQTVIPAQRKPSVSYARDFCFRPSAQSQDKESGLQNVDGLYAANDIENGTILFTEKTMGDCELQRSAGQYNCERVMLDDGMLAVVSSRDIPAGEFFCLKESDDEESASEAESESVDQEFDEDAP